MLERKERQEKIYMYKSMKMKSHPKDENTDERGEKSKIK